MRIHKVAKNIRSIEGFFLNTYRSFIGVVKILVLSEKNPKYPSAMGEDCIILGNGPSLKDTLAKGVDKLKKKPLMAVNNFAVSQEFYQLKPAYYVLLDPGFFLDKSRDDVKKLFHIMEKEVTWQMVFFVPYLYRKDVDVVRVMKNNPSVKITFFNYTIAKGYDFFTYYLYKKKLASPQFYNVLGISIFLGINMGYKNVWLVGADHSWFEELYVDDQNRLLRKDFHFYDKDQNRPLIPIIDPISGNIQKIGIFFRAMDKIFDSYYILRKYSDYMKMNIYNASEFSYVDAFERKKLE